jgi:hypothetical protein
VAIAPANNATPTRPEPASVPPSDTHRAKNVNSTTSNASDRDRCLPSVSWNAEISAARNAAQATTKMPASMEVPSASDAAAASACRNVARSWIVARWISVIVIGSPG